MTNRSAYGNKFGINVVNDNINNCHLSLRLDKYLLQGYSIILPYLDLSKINNNNVELHDYYFVYDNINNNIINITRSLVINSRSQQNSLYQNNSLSNITSTLKYIESINTLNYVTGANTEEQVTEKIFYKIYDKNESDLGIELKYENSDEPIKIDNVITNFSYDNIDNWYGKYYLNA